MTKQSHKKGGDFKGVLSKHIYIDPPPKKPSVASSILSPTHFEIFNSELGAWQKSLPYLVLNERLAKIASLCAHYKIDASSPDKWMLLCMALATDQVPGFQYQLKKRSGRKSQWDGLWHGILFHEVEKIRGTKSASWACGKLSKKPWNGKILSSGTLENHYYKAEKSSVGQARRAAESNPELAKMLYDAWEEISQKVLDK